MDFSKLTTGDKVLGGSGIALFIFSFLPWFGIEDYSGGGNAWDVGFFTGILPVLLGLALIGYIVITKLADGIELPELPIGWPLVVLIVAGLAALLVLLRLIMGYEVDYVFDTFKLDRKYGLYLSSLAAIGLAAGAFLKFKEDGGEFSTKSGGGGTTGQSGPPTPF